jgi:hypothetical protein
MNRTLDNYTVKYDNFLTLDNNQKEVPVKTSYDKFSDFKI